MKENSISGLYSAMSNSLCVSVIMPVYNAEKYLEKSLRDVMNQTIRDIEIICVDDGSTDSSPDILRKLSKEDPRVKIIIQEKKDAGAARNRGLEEARGKYLSFLDADDVFEHNMLENAFECAEKTRAEIVVFRSDRYNSKTGRYENANWTIKADCVPDKDSFAGYEVKDLFNAFSGWAWDKIYLHEYVKKKNLYFQEQKYINDRFFVETAFAGAGRISILDELLIHKRINALGALTTGYLGNDNWKYWLSAIKKIQVWLKKEEIYDQQEKNFTSFAVRNILWNLDIFVDCESFDKLFDYIKNEYLPELNLHVYEAEFFYDYEDFRNIKNIKEYDSDDYRWNRRICRKNGSYLFPFELVPKGSGIILYGAGKVGIEFYRQVVFSGWCKILAWIDKRETIRSDISAPSSIMSIDRYDNIVIAVRDEILAGEIREELRNMGVSDDKILWRSPEMEIKYR